MRLRLLCVVGLVIINACSSTPAAALHGSRSPSPTRAHLTAGGVVVFAVPHPSGQPGTCPDCAQGSGPLIAGGDGSVWFGDPYDHAIGRITPAGAITEFPFPGPAFSDAVMARDRGGNIWLAITVPAGIPDVYRITPTGAISAVPVPPVDIEEIAFGPDGNLWIAGGNQVAYLARLTPKGDYKMMGTPQPLGAAVGFAETLSTLWFLESGPAGAFLEKIQTSVRNVPLTGNFADDFKPSSMALGRDGNLWVLGDGAAEGAQVYRVTPAGPVTAFNLSNVGFAVGLVAGPDGNLWFVDRFSNGLGRVSPDGVLRILPMPAGFNLDQVAPGADGRMWFTPAGLDSIGSIGVTVPEATFVPSVLVVGPAPTSETIRNTGDAVLDIAALKLASTSVFNIDADGCTGKAIEPNGECSFSVGRTDGTGLAGDEIQVFDNATASPQTLWVAAGVQQCRLPVVSPPDPNAAISVGFLDVTTGVMAPAQDSFTYDATQLVYTSQAKPVLSGGSPAVYDSRFHRWVPTSPNAVSPDGSQYAYGVGQPLSTVHVVDVATGRDRTLGLPKNSWTIEDFAAAGIYLETGYETRPPGLWLVNPKTGSLTEVSKDVGAVGNGAIWISARNPADPHPPINAQGQPGYDEIQRRDLATGALTTWLYMPGTDIGVAGFAGANVFVFAVSGNDGTMLTMTAPGNAKPLHSPVPSDDPNLWAFAAAVQTSQGVWIPSRGGYLYLWTPGSGLIVVTKTAATPAGPCQ